MGTILTAEAEGRLECSASDLVRQYAETRWATEALCATLQPEDYVIQSMPDTSPTKWHLAHTTWFFETFVLGEAGRPYQWFHPDFAFLFNSYYVQAGDRWQRHHRGLLSRPTVKEVYQYRQHVDTAMHALLDDLDNMPDTEAAETVRLRTRIGLQHEQQHQELLLTDIKHVFSINPIKPVFRGEFPDICKPRNESVSHNPEEWVSFNGGDRAIGYEDTGFFYDNEKPRHKQYIPDFQLSTRTVTCGQYLEFVNDCGYKRPELWLSLGWAAVESNGWRAPLYWEQNEEGQWHQFRLSGQEPINLNEPVTHISYFEADAYARWKGCDLPTEAMWEVACMESGCSVMDGHFVEDGCLHPIADTSNGKLSQMLGNCWEWTSSPYTAYPGYRPQSGALGEYNGKFMCNQMVLRGGSCATPRSHIRPTYRNFFPPDTRWQFSGIRLARVLAE